MNDDGWTDGMTATIEHAPLCDCGSTSATIDWLCTVCGGPARLLIPKAPGSADALLDLTDWDVGYV